jgi:cytochrome c-type biogenesis protein CcmF
LLHSAIVMEKRDALKAWTVFLGILAFTFSMMGAFLVRSGLLTSVHAFAVDPQRGILLASILFVTAGSGFALFGLRAPELQPGGLFAPVSREASLVLNNLLLSAGLTSVALGTLYPLGMQAIFNKSMSVGAPYYLSVFAPIMVVAFAILPVSSLMSWKRSDLKGVLQRLALALGMAALVAAIGSLLYKGPDFASEAAYFVGLLAGAWLVFGTGRLLVERVGFKDGAWKRFRALPLATHGMLLAHIGLGLFVLGAVVETHGRLSAQQAMQVGDTVKLGGYEMTFTGTYAAEGSNYSAQGGVFEITRNGSRVCEARPQRRFYPASNETQSKVWLCFTPLSDLYVVMADPQLGRDGKAAATVRFFFNPWVRLVFLGPLLMALGGALSLADRRLRLGVAVKARDVKGEGE